MTTKEFSRALNQLHLEASIIEALTYQILNKADEKNLIVLVNVLNAFNAPAVAEEVDKKWCLNKIRKVSEVYKTLCLAVIEKPQLVKKFPAIYVQAFSVTARIVYANLSEEEFLDFYRTTIKMIGAADEYIDEKIFSDFLYLADSLQCCIEEIAELPRVQKMAMSYQSFFYSGKELN